LLVGELDLRTIGKYEITSEIGRGAMGEVYKARDPLIGRMVALKVITSGLSGKPELLERFYQEARSAGALQHPNIVTVYELGKEGDLPFIAMEYLGGESLEKMIARQAPMPLAQKVGYIIQICRALEYAHKHGVVHRDIKPGNIMGTTEGTVKVVDFGIARLVDASKTQTGTLIGTLGYMSPQQLRGEHADERSDIWAVGVLFYELLSYRRPFQGDNPAALMMSIISKEPPPLVSPGVDCNNEIEAIVFRMLQKEAIDRYQTMEEVLLDLDPVLRQLQQARVSELVAESQRLIEAGDLKTAQQRLREALHADSSHQETKALLDQVTRELRRQQVLPKVQAQLAKAQEKIDAGQFQQAKAEVQAALHLDSTYEPAREMLAEVEEAVQRTRELDKKLRSTKQRIAAGSLTDAGRELDEMLKLDPQNQQAQELRRQIQEEVDRREQRKRLTDGLQHARDLWSQLRYADCISELEALDKEFPDNIEIAKLLDTARTDQTETDKQKRLAEVRNLLANQQYEQAHDALVALQRHFPEDAGVQNLMKLALDEQGLAARQQRFQQELAALRKLVDEGKHAEAIRQGEPLLTEFPEEFELGELVNFARAEAQRAEQSRRLDEAIAKTRELVAKGAFAEAGQAAEAALAEFPGNGDLGALREEAQKKEQEQRRREQIEKRIREVRTRIEHDELTGAIELARETISTLGPDTNVGELLKTAETERQQRQRKKDQEEQVRNARSRLDAGEVEEATRILDQALATQLLDAADPRVKTFFADVEKKKKVDAAQTLLASGKVGEATQIVNQALATQLLDAADPRVKTFLVEVEKKKQELAAAAPPPPSGAPAESKEASSPTVFSATNISAPAESKAAPAAPPAKPGKAEKKPKSGKQAETAAPAANAKPDVAPAKPAPAKARPAPMPPVVAQPPKNKKTMVIALTGVVIAAVIGGGIYFATNHAKAPAASVASQSAATQTSQASAPPVVPKVNPLEQQQRQLIDQAQQLAGQGNFSAALQKLHGALKLNGPLQQNAQSLVNSIAKAQNNKAAQAALEKENRYWSQAVAAYQENHLDAAARDFQQVVGLGPSAHQAEARNYLDNLIPQARKSDQLYAQAETLARRTNDMGSLQQANQDLKQVIASGGPRAEQAARLQANVNSLLNRSSEYQALVQQFNAGTDNPATLRQLQSKFRSLESGSGTIGQQARLYADRRIPDALKSLQQAAAETPIPEASTSGAAKAAAPATSQRLLWVVTVDSGSVSGIHLTAHPLPYAMVAADAAANAQFELQLSIDSQGHVIGGRVLSGPPLLGRALIHRAEIGWLFSPPGASGATEKVSVQF
jgi:serine/threonine-protein kinase